MQKEAICLPFHNVSIDWIDCEAIYEILVQYREGLKGGFRDGDYQYRLVICCAPQCELGIYQQTQVAFIHNNIISLPSTCWLDLSLSLTFDRLRNVHGGRVA